MKQLSRLLGKAAFYFWTFLVMLILPNVLMLFTESTGVLTRVVSLLLALGGYWVALTLCRNPGKTFWWLFIFIFFAAFEIVLLYLFGEGPIAVDMFLNVVTTNVTEANELLFQIYPAVIFVFVVYVTGIVLSIVALRKHVKLHNIFRHNQRLLGTLIFAVGLVLLVVDYFVDKRFSLLDDVYPVNVSYNVGLSVQRTLRTRNYARTSAHFKNNAVLERTDSVPEVYVFVIGETLRADNLSLYGYGRRTTPRLQALADSTQALAVYADAITMSNTTHKSVPLLLTATASEGDFDSLYTQRGLISAFRDVGFDTWYVSNQRRNHSFIDFLGSEAEHVHFTKDSLPMSANVPDTELLRHLRQILPTGTDERLASSTLVVLHCYGSHFDYRDRYPSDAARFSPVDYPSATAAERDKLVNAYDNTVAYTDNLLADIVATLDSLGVPAVMFFTSDHGEDIYDDSRGRFLHASPQPTYYQLRVPLLVWASQPWREKHSQQWATILSHRALPVSTNMVAYHTVLDMAGIRTRLLSPTHALSSTQFAPSTRLYVNDHNQLRTIDNCGLKTQDVQQFKAHHLQYP